MRALVYRYRSICEPDMIDGFRKIGIDMDEMFIEEVGENALPGDVVLHVGNRVLEQGYAFIFSVNFFPEISAVCEKCKIPYISYLVDCPVLELYDPAIRNTHNYIFSFDQALYQEIVSANPDHIFYLPLASAAERLGDVCADITEEERERYKSDVTFIGSLYTEKCTYNKMQGASDYLKGYLDALIEVQRKVYGCNFLEESLTEEVVQEFKKCVPFYELPQGGIGTEKSIMANFYLGNKVTEQERLHLLDSVSKRFRTRLYTLSDTSTLPDIQVMGSAETMLEMPKIFNCSKINLNFTSKPIRTGIPQRIFDIMGAGGFVLTNYQVELSEYFVAGEHLDYFSSEEDLLEKIEFYLTHEEERRRIAENGQKLVKEYHTYDLRAAVILNTVFAKEG